MFGTRHCRSYPFDLNIVFDDGLSLGLCIDPGLLSPILNTLLAFSLSLNSLFYISSQETIVSPLILAHIDYADIVSKYHYLEPLNVVYDSLCRFVLRCSHCSL